MSSRGSTLGPNTVIHEEFKPAKQGELLPTRAEHEAATRPVERRTSLVSRKAQLRRHSLAAPSASLRTMST